MPSETSSTAWGSTISPSGRFAANAAWVAVQVMAHNLARWAARIGLGDQLVTTKTLRRRFFSIAGRLTHTARRLTLHLPQRWPWETQFSCALGPIARHSPTSLTARRRRPTRPPDSPRGCPVNSCQPSPPVPLPACRRAVFAGRRHCRPPPGHWRGHRALPSTPSIGTGPGPFAFPYPSSPVSTPPPYPFGGFGIRHRLMLHLAFLRILALRSFLLLTRSCPSAQGCVSSCPARRQ